MLNVEKYSEYIAKTIYDCKNDDETNCDYCECGEMCSQLYSVEQIKKWLFEKWKPHLTKDEKVILRNADKSYKYIARDKGGQIYIYKQQPEKFDDVWSGLGKGYAGFEAFKHLFQFIKFEDEEPYNIEELLKGE